MQRERQAAAFHASGACDKEPFGSLIQSRGGSVITALLTLLTQGNLLCAGMQAPSMLQEDSLEENNTSNQITTHAWDRQSSICAADPLQATHACTGCCACQAMTTREITLLAGHAYHKTSWLATAHLNGKEAN